MKINKIKKLKSIALERLSLCWGESVGICLVVMGMITVFFTAGVLALLLMGADMSDINSLRKFIVSRPPSFFIAAAAYAAVFCILTAPLKYSIYWFYFQTVRGKSVPASCFFSCYVNKEHFIKTVILSFTVLLIRFAAALPMRVLMLSEIYFAGKLLEGKGTVVYSLAAGGLVLLIACAAVFYFFVSLNCMLVPFIFASDTKASVRSIFSSSRRCVSGNVRYMTRTVFSFFGWIAAGVFIFPYVFSIPYFLMTLAALAKELLDGSGRASSELKKEKEEDRVLV